MTQNGGALFSGVLASIPEGLLSPVPEIQDGDFSWYAVQTRPRHEKKVHLGLQEKGIRTFLPLYREKRQWSDRQQWIEQPLFSHYVFVQIPARSDSRGRVLRTNGVLRFAGVSGYGTPVPDEQIENLRVIVDRRIPLTPHTFLQVGERVRIRGGALHGIEGIVAAVRNDKSLVVSVELIQKSIAIRIDGFDVEPV